MKCRFDTDQELTELLDLGHCPPSNSYLTKSQLDEPEVTYPLRVFINPNSYYVQLPEFKRADEIFGDDYAYFSSFSTSWMEHCRKHCETLIPYLGLTKNSFVVEVASNDGYLLRNFLTQDIPCLGIEPCSNVAAVAQAKGVPTLVTFFGEATASEMREGGKYKKEGADLIVANNVFAHVPDVRDFVKGFARLLASDGVATVEFPHLMTLLKFNQFDTIYHEHYSYFSLGAAQRIFGSVDMEIFRVEQLETHGGSLRLYVKHKSSKRFDVDASVAKVEKEEREAGLNDLSTYLKFKERVEKVKDGVLEFLLDCKKQGKKVAAYGAAAKGNTLLNYCGIKPDLLSYVVDASPHKQGRFLPGSHIPIVSEARIQEEKPDYVFILPWNLRKEIGAQLSYIRSWNGKFVVAVPEIEIF